MIECKRANGQIQLATEVESVESLQRQAQRSANSLATVARRRSLTVGTRYKLVKLLRVEIDPHRVEAENRA